MDMITWEHGHSPPSYRVHRIRYQVTIALGVLLVLVAQAAGEETVKISDLAPVCKAGDPGLTNCMLESAQQMLNKMENGIPAWGVPPLDPLKVNRMVVNRGGGVAAFNITLFDSYHHGLSKIKFVSVNAKPEKYEITFKVWLPRYSIVGKYQMNGRLLLLPITGRGHSNITLSNLTAEWKLTGQPIERDGRTYMDIQQFRVQVFPERVRVRFDNLFEGNRLLGDTMNSLLNTHWKELHKELGPALEESISDLHLSLTRKMFSQVPYSELFPDL